MVVFTLKEEFLGKKVFKDKYVEKLKEKFHSAKATFISVEFTQEKENCKCLLVTKDELLNLIIEDIEKCEKLISRESKKRQLLEKVNSILEEENPLSFKLSEEEIEKIKHYAFVTAKPVVLLEEGVDLPSLLQRIFQQTGTIFFFTVNKKEARAWQTKKGSSILECAGKIHSDLAKGFIKGEVFNVKDLDNFWNLEEARQKGILKVVNKDYIVCDGDVINIKFKV